MIFIININRFKGKFKARMEQGLDQVVDRLQRDLQQATPREEAQISTAWGVEHSGDKRQIINNHSGVLDLEYGTENRAPAGTYRTVLAAFSTTKRRRK